ncbi:PD-(D/E)XK nuclease family transposase [uncultured Robinsoniella sp.]|uniref:PD-(D/E)XK nuclease family transposase n=1 Tax=uncultured Robinsoniella sp. TaxID=904190 RepID=UPI00374E5206
MKNSPQVTNIQMKNELLQWAKFLNGKREEDFREMAEKNEYINEAFQILKNISADDKKRVEYESREKAIRDYNHLIYIAKKEGMEEGMEQGIQQGIKLFIQDNIEEGILHERIIEKLQKRFKMDSDSAEKYYDRYK